MISRFGMRFVHYKGVFCFLGKLKLGLAEVLGWSPRAFRALCRPCAEYFPIRTILVLFAGSPSDFSLRAAAAPFSRCASWACAGFPAGLPAVPLFFLNAHTTPPYSSPVDGPAVSPGILARKLFFILGRFISDSLLTFPI
jgi:hypothetical protein